MSLALTAMSVIYISATCQLYRLHKRRPYDKSSSVYIFVCVCVCVCVYVCMCVRERESFNLISSQILDSHPKYVSV